MTYSRSNPSARYVELVSMYRAMHTTGDKAHGVPPEKMFPGYSLPPHAGPIKNFLDRLGAKTVLDYGCGKGQQYGQLPVTTPAGATFNSIPDYWGVAVSCYDPAYTPFSTLPAGTFDVVICTDVLEHCPEEDLDWIVGEMFAYAARGVYANVAIYPAMKTLPNGENAHTTLRPAQFWQALFERKSRAHGSRAWVLVVEDAVVRNGQTVITQDTLGSAM